MISFSENKATISGNGATVMAEFTAICNALLQSFDGVMDREDAVEMLKYSVDMAAMPVEELEAENNKYLDSLTESQRQKILEDFLKGIR